jgi:hypothetical protein
VSAPVELDRRTSSSAFVAKAFALSRLCVWVVALYVVLVYEPHPFPLLQGAAPTGHELGLITKVWSHGDSGHFLAIARHGYQSTADSAFFPLYPAAVALLGRILFGYYTLAGILISLAAFAASCRLLLGIAQAHVGDLAARRAVVYLVLAPMSVFLQAVYSESLYLLLALSTFVLAERRRYAAAGAAAGLALLCRPSGIALFPPLLLLAWRSQTRARSILASMAGALLFAIYPLVLWLQTSNPWRFLHAEHYWQRKGSVYGPFGGAWDGLSAAWDGVRQLTGQVAHPFEATNPSRIAALNIEYLLFLLLFAALTVVVWRRLGAAYGLFALLSICLPLSVPARFYPLESLPRFGVVVFPFYVALGLLGGRPSADRSITALSALLLGATTVQWALGEWVS